MLFLYGLKMSIFLCMMLLVYGFIKDLYNVVVLFIYLELMLLWLMYNWGTLASTVLFGWVFAFEILALAAIKAAVGLAVIVSWVRYTGTLSLV